MKKINLLNKVCVSVLFLLQMLIFTSCTPADMTHLKSNDSPGSFHYEYGNSAETHGEFWIWTENGVTYFESLAEAADMYVDAFAEVNTEVFDSIAQIILENRIDLWDGFSKSDTNVLDGHGFSLDIEYGANSIHADGYMYEPENYQAGHEALLKFLCDYAESLPVYTPPADSVGYIVVSTKEYRFDLMFDLYDGVYSRVDYVNVAKKSADTANAEASYRFYRSRYGDEIAASQREKYVECNFESANQIREKSLELLLSDGLPGFGKDDSEYVAIHYEGRKIKGSHSYYAALTDEEQNWLTIKMLSVVGLPDDFSINSLFDND